MTTWGTRAQAPAWQTAVALSPNSGYASVLTSATDAAGHVYLGGVFSGTVTLGTTTLSSVAGSLDMFVTKWDVATGQFVWAQAAGGPEADYVRTLAVSGANVYVGGTYRLAAAFGPAALASGGAFNSLFVAKLVDAGATAAFVWAQQPAAATSSNAAYALAVNGSNVYMGGSFFGPGTVQLGATTLTNASTSLNGTSSPPDGYVAKLVDAGPTAAFAWAQSAGGTGNDNCNGLAVVGANVYATGTFEGTAAFGTTRLASAGGTDAYVAKFTDEGATGRLTWAQRAGGPGAETAPAIAANGASVYIAGAFTSAAAGFGDAQLLNAGGADAYVAKLTDAGPTAAFAWAQAAGGPTDEGATGLAVVGTNVYVDGFFRGAATAVGNTPLANADPTGATNDLFVAKLRDTGPTSRFDWAQRAGGPGTENLSTLAAAGATVYVSGVFAPPAAFGPVTLTNTVGPSSGFVAALVDNVVLANAPPVSAGPGTLYPNPARTAATLRWPAGTGRGPARVSVTDALGRLVWVQTVDVSAAGLVQEIDLTGLRPGGYLVRVQTAAAKSVHHLTVE
ncbi:T9SS type A sorting domain-containing protein [Hymenobacter nivis]|uniref:T9SS type A sorting domain-containing protein n=1 Tax=Hymenobacter nivis TaxID=1850093 RepID=UPI001375514D|nr:T9SS type A sorting domain-containing protein [Hymenobacter nivis]